MIRLAIIILCLAMLAGCDFRGLLPWGSSPPAPIVDPLVEIGREFIFWGALAAGIAVATWILRAIPIPALGIFTPLLAILAPFSAPIFYFGATSVAVGYGISFIGNHPLLGFGAGVLALVATYLHRHPAVGGRVVAWLKARTQKPQVKGN